MVDSLPLRNLKYYCDLFSKIKVNKSKQSGEAPYKPILLLSVIELISDSQIQDNKIYISDDLIDTFDKYWKRLNPDTFKGGLALPFFHLKNDGFWKLKFSDIYSGGRPQTIPKIRADVDYAILDQELYKLLQEPEARRQLIDTLIEAWFSSSQKQLEDILEINQVLQQNDDTELDRSVLDAGETQIKYYFRKSIVRDALFRKSVVHLYDYQCSFCGLKVIHSLTQSIVDGAHIKPFARFYDNQINNGLSLCKNHHWAFDQGLFTIDDQYKIMISKDFQEISPNAKAIKDFHGMNILLPNLENHYPKLEAIQWHRQNIFRN
ncbi:MAG: HNH endonuclease [Microcystis aeruginosa BS13-02]|uniref:HNH endonuclease n=1 Tax=Microcystis aeruginosa Ma_MB_S_20031200_S102 TaxID=2486254 RepID=A0A552ES47_MICAE|nr:HNH endonuclease [Microcystis aeruginosa]MDB9509302.1 HNH endonuclease [Microcystis aeruginosa CS-338/01]NCS24422.1 HNH endonuclease [Microcystis aeruginosa BS13-02]TRU23571.1 MAG: HNH endonuclease [Microcystis aeruginosa Ma_MB_S_20031200_S102D]TRU37277.1 MAG: HNH endonuclease [Microcystis aeruginosa Ma_MB_S_20031200_S102]